MRDGGRTNTIERAHARPKTRKRERERERERDRERQREKQTERETAREIERERAVPTGRARRVVQNAPKMRPRYQF